MDQDGNQYPSLEAKLAFLEQGLQEGIRSGNLKPITTLNQWQQLVDRINRTRTALQLPEIRPPAPARLSQTSEGRAAATD